MNRWIVLDHMEGIRLRGPDAVDFAQSQFTGDVEALPPARWQPMGWCDARGRAVAVVLVSRRQNGIDLVLPASQADTTARRLEMYAIHRAVEIEPGAQVSGSMDARDDDPRLCMDDSRSIDLERTDAAESPDTAKRWLLSDLRCAMPWLEEATSGRYLPQMLGLETLGGVSYTKGCYPGQEVVARVHYLGRHSRRLSAFTLCSGTVPAAGAPILDEDGAESGTVLWAIARGEGSAGLAVVKLTGEESRTISVDGGTGLLRAPAEI